MNSPQPSHISQVSVPKWPSRDRLSELPDSVIITILSFLEMRDAVRTTVLSRLWKDRWTSVTSLIFSRPGVGDLDRYRSFVYRALLRWKGAKILRFDLSFLDVKPFSLDLESWLLFVIEKQVEELRLCMGSVRDAGSYYFPLQRLYTCSSIRELSLSYVTLNIPENVQLSQLTSLRVKVPESLSGLGLTRLLSGAPMLEELALLGMKFMEEYSIRSASLKKLQIQCIDLCSMLSIWAPNLSTLEIIASYGSWALTLDVPSLTTAILNFFKLEVLDFCCHQVFLSICHAQSLTLSDGCIEVLLDLKRKGMSVEFSNAKHLDLSFICRAVAGEWLLTVLEMFPNLLTLIATVKFYAPPQMDVDSFSAFEKKVDIPLPHLKTCEISFNATNSSILRAIQAVLENGEMLEKMVLRVRNEKDLGWGALGKVLSMRRVSPEARVIISKQTIY